MLGMRGKQAGTWSLKGPRESGSVRGMSISVGIGEDYLRYRYLLTTHCYSPTLGPVGGGTYPSLNRSPGGPPVCNWDFTTGPELKNTINYILKGLELITYIVSR